MKWEKQLMPPMLPGVGVTQEKWDSIFGPNKHGMDDAPPPVEDVYERKVREHLAKQGRKNEQG
jgi:hypothetical protein